MAKVELIMPWGVPHSVGIDHGVIDVGMGVELELTETVSLTSSSSLWIFRFSRGKSWIFYGKHCVEVYNSPLHGNRNCYGTLRKKTALKAPIVA